MLCAPASATTPLPLRWRCELSAKNDTPRTVEQASPFIEIGWLLSEDSLEAFISWIKACVPRGTTDSDRSGEEGASSSGSFIAVVVGEATVANADGLNGIGWMGYTAARARNDAGVITRRLRFTRFGCGFSRLGPTAAGGDGNENNKQAGATIHVWHDR